MSTVDESESEITDSSSTIPLHPLDRQKSSSSVNSTSCVDSGSDSESGIVLHFGEKVDNSQQYVPSLPTFDDSPKLSKYSGRPVVASSPLTERDEEDIRAARNWRTYTIASIGGEVITNDAALDIPDIEVVPPAPQDSKETEF